MEWKRMGFGGQFTFKNFRTSMVHYNKHKSPKKKQLIHRAMCHSEDVASRFYTTLNTASEAAQVRKLQAEESSPEKSITSSPEKKKRGSRRCLFVESSQESEEEEEQQTHGSHQSLSRPPASKRKLSSLSSSSEDDSGPERQEEEQEEEEQQGEGELFILQSPVKNPQTDATMCKIGADPSAGHTYLGRPVLVSQKDMKLLEAKVSPRVKMVKAKCSTVMLSSSDDEDIEESAVYESFKFV
ncbi:hypothetical protein AMEX_G12765 [Astyanax mexicanus]|uniref:Uncharacterized protein n=1 Tax=Astyanax mexicanus TaxID=7994 RepID=A0A8T2LPK0_ASTMX|nr:hypothetical protein AMEX_G12765 [Astyanax mexicanus]